MASDISQKRMISPILRAVIDMLTKRKGSQYLIRKGYTHWQITTGLREGFDKGFITRKGDEFYPTNVAIDKAASMTNRDEPNWLKPLDDRRVEKISSLESYTPGRRALEQIRNRVST